MNESIALEKDTDRYADERPITQAEIDVAIKSVSRAIEAMGYCDCLQQGLRPCGACGIAPIRRG